MNRRPSGYEAKNAGFRATDNSRKTNEKHKRDGNLAASPCSRFVRQYHQISHRHVNVTSTRLEQGAHPGGQSVHPPRSSATQEVLRDHHRIIADRGREFIEPLERALRGKDHAGDRHRSTSPGIHRAHRTHIALEVTELSPLCRTHLDPMDWVRFRATVESEHDPIFGNRLDEEYRDLHRQVAACAGCGCLPP